MKHRSQYPAEWPKIADAVKAEHGYKCERCGTPHGPPPAVLTVHHLDGNKMNCEGWNLAALCQVCHLKIQGRVNMDQLFFLDVLPMSDWFKPHYAGYLRSRKEKP